MSALGLLAYNSNTFTEGALERGRPPWQDGETSEAKQLWVTVDGAGGLDAARHETHTLRDLAPGGRTRGSADAGRGQVLVRGSLCLFLYEKGRVMKIIKS